MHGVRCPDERSHPSNNYKATTRERAFFLFTRCHSLLGREADFIVGDGTEEDAKKALERYHGSSSAAMLLDIDDDKRTLEKIQKFIYVSKDRKAEIRKLWEEGEMSDNKPLLVCASCGMSDNGEYAEEEVANTYQFFSN